MTPAPQSGFTLIEAVVALVVMALLLGASQRGLSAGWRGVRTADLEIAALSVARARLASAGVETPLMAGLISGTEAGGITWTERIRPYAARGSESGAARRPLAYWTAVEVRWSDGTGAPERTLTLETLKLARTP